jgi:lipoate-protein ligase A
MKKPLLNFVIGSDIPIFEQLKREEALFRANDENWCIIVQGSSPAIVLGAFGLQEELIEMDLWQKDPISIIRRFSGGGTVVVDHDTLFIAWILNANDLSIQPFPNEIFQWVLNFFQPTMKPLNVEGLENDFCLKIEDSLLKFAGHAQSIAKQRFVHHSSFLWDYNPHFMQLLKHPKRQPKYRSQRPHHCFLYPLKHTVLCQKKLISQLYSNLNSLFEITKIDYSILDSYLGLVHRKSTTSLYSN